MSSPSNNKLRASQDKALEASSSKPLVNSLPRATGGVPRSRSTVSRNPLDEAATLNAIKQGARVTTGESKSLKREAVRPEEGVTPANEANVNDPQWIHPLLLIEASKTYRETVLRDRSTCVPPPSLVDGSSYDVVKQSDRSLMTTSQSESSVGIDLDDQSDCSVSQSENSVAVDPILALTSSLTVLHTSPSVLLRSILKRPAVTAEEDAGRCGDTIPNCDKKVRWQTEVDVIYYDAGDGAVERTSEKLAEEHKATSIYTRAPVPRVGSIDRCPFEDPCPLRF